MYFVIRCGWCDSVKMFGFQTVGYRARIFVLDAGFSNLLRFYELANFEFPTTSTDIGELRRVTSTILALKRWIQHLWTNSQAQKTLKKLKQVDIPTLKKNLPTAPTPQKGDGKGSKDETSDSNRGKKNPVKGGMYDAFLHSSWLYDEPSVILGKRVKDNKQIAFKCFNSEEAGKREAEILLVAQKIPFVVPLLDCFAPNSGISSKWCLVFPKLDPFPIYELSTKKEVIGYMSQLLACLHGLHSLAIAHLDVKPNNLMVDPLSRELRLIDFGAASICLPDAKSPTFTLYDVPIVGSVGFAPPEIDLDEEDADSVLLAEPFKVDVYSSGVVFLFMIVSYLLNNTPAEIYGQRNLEMISTRMERGFIRPAIMALFDCIQAWKEFRNKQPPLPLDDPHMWVVSAIPLCYQMLAERPYDRVTIQQVLSHSLFHPQQENLIQEKIDPMKSAHQLNSDSSNPSNSKKNLGDNVIALSPNKKPSSNSQQVFRKEGHCILILNLFFFTKKTNSNRVQSTLKDITNRVKTQI